MLLTSWLAAFGRCLFRYPHGISRPKTRRRSRPRRQLSLETLEIRTMLSVTLRSLVINDMPGGKDELVALPASDSDGHAVSFSAISSDPSVSATIVNGGRSLLLNVSGTDAGNQPFSGALTLLLFEDAAPVTTARLIQLANSGFYNGLTFHRVIQDFVAQGGDPAGTGSGGTGVKFIDEFATNLTFTSNGLLAMANSGDDTNDSQFFITDVDLALGQLPQHLNFQHTIFGMLTSGFDTFRKLIGTPTDGNGRPLQTATITSAAVFTDDQNGVLRLHAPAGFTGSSNIIVTAATDDSTDQQTFTLNVVPDAVNDRPFLGPVSSQTTLQGTPITFSVDGTDIDGDALTFVVRDAASFAGNNSVGSAPANIGASIQVTPASGGTPAVATITLTPQGNFTGTASLIVGVRDNVNRSTTGGVLDSRSNFDTQAITLTVTPFNHPPTLANSIPDHTFQRTLFQSLTITADVFADIDGDALSYTAKLASGDLLPDWLSFVGATRTFSGTPAMDDDSPLIIAVTADDGHGGDATATFVLSLNHLPTVENAVPPQSLNGAGPPSFVIAADAFFDLDGDVLTYTATLSDGSDLPSWLTFDPATRTFSGNPSVSDDTPLSIRVTADDGHGGIAFTDFELTLDNVNDSPIVAHGIPSQILNRLVLQSFTFAANTFADGDVADVLTFSAELAGGDPLPGWLTFDPATLTFNGTPGLADVSPLEIEVAADDGHGGTAVASFTLLLNSLPVVQQAIPDQTFSGSGTKSFTFAAEVFADGDGDTLNFAATLAGGAPLPAWLTFDGATRTFSGNPGVADDTPLEIVATAGDGFGSASTGFQLTLDNVNDDPTVAHAIPAQTMTGAGMLAFTIAADTFNDFDGDPLTYAAALSDGGTLPTWLTFHAATRTFSGNPSDSDDTPLSIRVTADDRLGGTAFADFELTLVNVNDAPIVSQSIPNHILNRLILQSFTFSTGTFSDGDSADALTYSAQLSSGDPLPGWLSFDPATRTFSGMPGPADESPLNIAVTADDGHGGTAVTSFALTLNTLPVVNQTIPHQTFSGSGTKSFTFDANTFFDGDGDTLSYTATLSGGDPLPAWLTFDPATRTFGGNPSVSDATPLEIVVSASDGFGSVSTSFELTLDNVNDVPTVAHPIPAQTFSGAGAHAFTFALNTFDDFDGDTLTYTATLTGGGALPSWLTFNGPTRTFSGNPSVSHSTPLSIRVTAADGRGGMASTDFELTLSSVNDAPTVSQGIPDHTFGGAGVLSFTFDANAFTDADGDSLAYMATRGGGGALPEWLSFDGISRTFSGNPRNFDATSLPVSVTASDGHGGTVVTQFQLFLDGVNDPPTVLQPIVAQTFTGSGVKSFTFSASTFADLDGDTLTYTATLVGGGSLPAWLTFSPTTRTFSGNPSVSDATPLNVLLAADDGHGGTSSTSFQLVLNQVNDAPILNPIGNKRLVSGATFTFQIFASDSDPDGDTLSYSASELPAGATFNAASRTFQWTPAQNQAPADYQVAFTVSDGITSVSETITISVTPQVTVYRAFLAANNDHFYTTSFTEYQTALANGYVDESSLTGAYLIAQTEVDGSSVLFRLFNPSANINGGGHYYTYSEFEKNLLVARGWVLEPSQGYLFQTQVPGTVEVFRLYNPTHGKHVFTTSTSERDSLLASGWQQHSSLGFAFPFSTSTSSNNQLAEAEESIAAALDEPESPLDVTGGVTKSDANASEQVEDTIFKKESSVSQPSTDATAPVIAVAIAALQGSPPTAESTTLTLISETTTNTSVESPAGTEFNAPVESPLASNSASSTKEDESALDHCWETLGQSLLSMPKTDPFS